MDAYQKHLSQSRCRASPEPLLFQALTKQTQCNSITHTGTTHGSNQAGPWVPPRSSAGISCATNGAFQQQRSSKKKTFFWCWYMLNVDSWVVKNQWCCLERAPFLNSQFKFKLLGEILWIWAYRVVCTHIPVLLSVIFIKHTHLVQSILFFLKERNSIPSLSVSLLFSL